MRVILQLSAEEQADRDAAYAADPDTAYDLPYADLADGIAETCTDRLVDVEGIDLADASGLYLFTLSGEER